MVISKFCRKIPTAILVLSSCVLALHATVPNGWHLAGSKPMDFEVAVDASHGYQGHASATLACKQTCADGFGTLMQSILADDYEGQKVRLSGFVKANDVTGWSGLWLRVDKGKDVIALDNMQDRAIKGTQDWQRYDVVLEVPAQATGISFGIILNGGGKVSLSNTNLEVVGSDVPVTAHPFTKVQAKPVNMDFSE
jgi:hypothetical protein